MSMKNQKGHTFIEFLIVLGAIVAIFVIVFAVFWAVHTFKEYFPPPHKTATSQKTSAIPEETMKLNGNCHNEAGHYGIEHPQALLTCEIMASEDLVHPDKGDEIVISMEKDGRGIFVATIAVFKDQKVFYQSTGRSKSSPIKALAEATSSAAGKQP